MADLENRTEHKIRSPEFAASWLQFGAKRSSSLPFGNWAKIVDEFYSGLKTDGSSFLLIFNIFHRFLRRKETAVFSERLCTKSAAHQSPLIHKEPTPLD